MPKKKKPWISKLKVKTMMPFFFYIKWIMLYIRTWSSKSQSDIPSCKFWSIRTVHSLKKSHGKAVFGQIPMLDLLNMWKNHIFGTQHLWQGSVWPNTNVGLT
jgi:hypothetical protein